MNSEIHMALSEALQGAKLSLGMESPEMPQSQPVTAQ